MATTTHDTLDEPTASTLVDDVGDRLREVVGVMRDTAGEVGERLPDMIQTVRAGAVDGARMMQSWPDPTQRMVAAVSLGLGVGMTLAGAPRLIIAATLVPAMVVATAIVTGQDGRSLDLA
jgi:hypothetical protein